MFGYLVFSFAIVISPIAALAIVVCIDRTLRWFGIDLLKLAFKTPTRKIRVRKDGKHVVLPDDKTGWNDLRNAFDDAVYSIVKRLNDWIRNTFGI